MGLNDGPRPTPGERRRFVADGHDAGSSVGAKQSVEAGHLTARYWLTPSGALIEEGRTYEVEWQERFRTARYSTATGIRLLRLRGGWVVVSESLPASDLDGR